MSSGAGCGAKLIPVLDGERRPIFPAFLANVDTHCFPPEASSKNEGWLDAPPTVLEYADRSDFIPWISKAA